MNGNEVYENKYIEMINNLIERNKDFDFLKDYAYSMNNKSYSSIHTYLICVIKFLRETNKKLEDIKYVDYNRYLIELKQRTTSSYQITVYAALKSFSKFLVNADYSEKDYMENIETPKAKEGIETKKKREAGFLTKEEIQMYINNVKNCSGKTNKQSSYMEKYMERDLAIIILFLTTGMRCSAIYKLDLKSIDFKNKTIVTVDKEEHVELHCLLDETIDIINNWLKVRNSIVKNNEEALFITNDGKRLSTRSIAYLINKYAYNIKGKNITPHKLRATYGTQIYEKTHDILAVQQCMGHASPETTKRYIRGQENENRKMAANIMKQLVF